MGVDATIFVVADYSRDADVAFGSAMLALDRDYDLFDGLHDLPVVGHRTVIQVMQGSWGRTSTGERHDPEDVESGYLFGDSYAPDAGFKVHNVADLARLRPLAEHLNAAVIDFLLSAFPKNTFIVIYH